jgi:hypothetical protein
MLRDRLFSSAVYAMGGDGGGAPPPSPQPPPQPPAPSAAPWGSDANAEWKVGDKPWYEVHTPEGPQREFFKQKGYKNPAQAFDALYSATRMINGNSVEIPNENDDKTTPQAWDAFYSKLGRPANKTEYKLDFGKDGEGKPLTPDPALAEFAQDVAYNMGASPKKAQQLVNMWNEFATKSANAQNEKARGESEAAVNAFKQKHGADADSRIEGGKRVFKALGLDAQMANQIESMLGTGVMMELFARMGMASAEGKMIDNGQGGGDPNDPNRMSPEQAAAAIKRLDGDETFMKKYMNGQHPEHQWAVDHKSKLYAKAGGLIT